MESALASPLAEAIQSVETENQTAVLQATETAQQPAAEPKKTGHKVQAAAKGSTKSAKAASPAAAAESPAAKSAITPTKSATKTRARAAAR